MYSVVSQITPSYSTYIVLLLLYNGKWPGDDGEWPGDDASIVGLSTGNIKCDFRYIPGSPVFLMHH